MAEGKVAGDREKLRWINLAALVCALAVCYLFVFPISLGVLDKMDVLDSIPNGLGTFLEISLAPLGWLFDHVPIYAQFLTWLFDVFDLPQI